MIFFKAHKTAVVIYSSLLIKGLVGGARLCFFFSKKIIFFPMMLKKNVTWFHDVMNIHIS